MKLYFDLFAGDEIISDSYNIVLKHNDVIGEVDSKYIAKGDVEVDIGCGN